MTSLLAEPTNAGPPAISGARSMAMTNVERMEARLARWRAEIAVLAARVEKVGSQAGLNVLQGIDDLKAKCAETQARIDRANVSPKGKDLK